MVEAADTPPLTPTLFTAASRDSASGDVIVKVVNSRRRPPAGGDRALRRERPERDRDRDRARPGTGDVTTVAAPTKVAPQASTLADPTPRFEWTFPPHSFTVIRMKPAS